MILPTKILHRLCCALMEDGTTYLFFIFYIFWFANFPCLSLWNNHLHILVEATYLTTAFVLWPMLCLYIAMWAIMVEISTILSMITIYHNAYLLAVVWLIFIRWKRQLLYLWCMDVDKFFLYVSWITLILH